MKKIPLVITMQDSIDLYAEMIESCKELGNEEGHIQADNLLCEILKSLGYGKVVEEFDKLSKWYA